MHPLPDVQTASPGANLLIEFTPAGGGPQTRAATRITLDGTGGLIIHAARAAERLVLNEIRDLRIKPCRHLRAAMPPTPRMKPAAPAVVGKYVYVLMA